MDLNEDIIEDFKCALTNDDEPHYVIKPITLKCGHCVCKDCISLKVANSIATECKICHKITDRDISNDDESILANKAIKSHIAGLFVSIKNQFRKSLNMLQGIV